MVERRGGLDQGLYEPSVRLRAVPPHHFPYFVRGEELPPVEQRDPGQVSRVVFFRVGPHGSNVAAGGRLAPRAPDPAESDMLFSSRLSIQTLLTWCRAMRHGLHAGLSPVRVFRHQAKSGPAAGRALA